MMWTNRRPNLSDELSRLRDLKPHEVLNIELSASIDEIKNAYRQKVKVYHPDKSGPFMKKHNEEVVKIVNDAYRQLMLHHEGEK